MKRYFITDIKNAASSAGLAFSILVSIPVLLLLLFGLFGLLIYGEWGTTNLVVRAAAFFISLAIALIVVPAGCYGSITEKRYGTSWIMIPESTTVKTASMILISCIIAPALFILAYGCLDALVCILDKRCGEALFSLPTINTIIESIQPIPATFNDSAAIFNPALYFGDIICISLTFLLGALCFKKHKVAKTVLCIFVLFIIISAITAPTLIHRIQDTPDPEIIRDRFNWVLEHTVLIKILGDTIVNLALCTAIFFRVKNIKH